MAEGQQKNSKRCEEEIKFIMRDSRADTGLSIVAELAHQIVAKSTRASGR